MGGAPSISRESYMNFVSKTVSKAFFDVANECTTTVGVDQSINIFSRPTEIAESSAACQICLDTVNTDMNFQMFLLRQKRGYVDAGKMFDAAYKSVRSCDTICKTLVMKDISQLALVNVNTKCQFDASVVEEWQNRVKGDLLASLYSRTDDIGDALTRAVGSSDKDNTYADVTNRVTTLMTREMANSLLSSVTVNQDVTVNADASALFKGIEQSVVVIQSANYLMVSKAFDGILTDSQWAAFVKNSSDASTLGALADALTGTVGSFTNVIRSTVGIFSISLLAALIVLLVVLIVILILRNRRRT